MKKRGVLATLFLLLGSLIQAEDLKGYSVEIDPSTYIFNGYSIHLKKDVANWQLGIGTYAMDFPDALVNLDGKNKDRGWKVKLNSAIGVFADYYPNEKKKGWFSGLQIAQQNYQLTRNSSDANYDVLLVMGSIGYRYNVTEHFYLKPWAGIGYVSKISGTNSIGDTTYDIPNIVPFMTLHAGYAF